MNTDLNDFETFAGWLLAEADVEAGEIRPDSHIVDDLCLDSFDMVWTAMRLWDEAGIDIPDELLSTIETLGELHAVVVTKLQH